MRAFPKLMVVCVVLLVLAAFSALVVLNALGQPRKVAASIEQMQAAEGMPVAVTRPVRMAFTEYIHCDGAIVADVRAMLRAKIEEVVEAVHVRVGEPVKKGQVLVEFRRADLDAAIRAAETAFREAESSLARYTKLAEEQVIAADRLEQVQTMRDAAASALEAARSRLSFAQVASPIDGYVEARWVEPGEHKGLGNELLSIVDLSAVQVRALLSDKDVAALSIGAEAEFQTDASAEWLTGRIDRVSPATGDPNRFFEVFLKVQNPLVNGNWLLRPGAYAEVRFVRRVVTDALGVPVNAVAYEGNDRVVYVVAEGVVTIPDLEAREKAQTPGFTANVKRGLARLKAKSGNNGGNPTDSFTKEVTGTVARRVLIRPGLSAGDFVQITDAGIGADTVVIVNPRDDMKDGTFVRVVEGGDAG
jgi:membrane fusion protein (multidrug efflux system)